MVQYFFVTVICCFSCTFCCRAIPPFAEAKKPPPHFSVTANVSKDSSGRVAFTTRGINAALYDYDFGDSIFKSTGSKKITHTYRVSGTYTVHVTAKNTGGQIVAAVVEFKIGYRLSLVWSDEFDVPGLPNSLKWGYDIGTGGDGWGNNELEYYTNRIQNAEVVNGVLKITAARESYNGSTYTSARLLTKNKFSFKYGKIEVRAKLPAGVGTWPAIWMLGDNIAAAGWPDCGEADIMEHRGSELNKIFGTLHYPGRSGANGNGSTVMINDVTAQFHNYILEWSPAAIKFYVDTQLYFTVTNTGSLPFKQNFFIILNVAMGGGFGGTVDPAFKAAAMEVDYVRVYQ